jgi:uridine kinase
MIARSSRGVLVGIAGGSGSGKTSVARLIYEDLGPDKVVILRQDNYYKDLSDRSPEERAIYNFDHPDAFDTPLLIQHVKTLLDGGTVDIPSYDYVNHVRTDTVEKASGNRVILLEGILIFYNLWLRERMGIKVYIQSDADIRFIRRLKRDVFERGRTVESVISQYETFVRPMHAQFVEPTKRYADVIIPRGAHNSVAVGLLKTQIRAEAARFNQEGLR